MVCVLKTLIPPTLMNTRILVKTDNIAAMYALSTGRTKDPVLAACAREVWLVAAVHQVDILIKHFPGDSLILADALSRASFNPKLRILAGDLVLKMKLSRLIPVNIASLLTSAL